MLVEATTICEDIIEIHNYVLIEHIKEDLVYQPLEA